MTNSNKDLSVEVAKLDSSVKSAHKRIDELQVVIKAFYELAGDVKAMATELITMRQDINDIKSDVDEYHKTEPNKLIFNAKNSVITTIVGALVGALIALILK